MSSLSTCEIFKMPRKDINFFSIGGLYKLKYNDSYKFRIRYTMVDVKQIDLKKLSQPIKTVTNAISNQLIRKFDANFEIQPTANLYNSFVLNDIFVCLEANATILKNFKSVMDGKDVNAGVFKQVPIFLFHDKKNQKPIIGCIQIDLNKQNLDELFGEQKNEALLSENLVYIENFFEKIN